MEARQGSLAWQRWAWLGGVVFVVALIGELVVTIALPINQNDSPAKIAHALDAHHQRVVAAACLSVVYAVGFLVYLTRLHSVLRTRTNERLLVNLVLSGGLLMIAMHAVSDIGIYGMLGAKVASYAAHHDPGISYTLYLVTFAVDSVGDVFGSLFLAAAGLLIVSSGLLPRWLAWSAVLAGVLLFFQGFGLGGVISNFGLILDLIGFLLFLIFVLASSSIFLRRGEPLGLDPGKLAQKAAEHGLADL